MTDETLDPRFERELRLLLADQAPSDAPASLRAAVAAVPRAAGGRRAWRPARAFAPALLAAAAVVVVGLAALAGAIGPVNQPATGGLVTPQPTADARVRLDYVADGPSTDGDLSELVAVLEARLTAAGIRGAVTMDGSTVRVTIDDAARADEARELLGTPGRVDFVPLGTTPAASGQVIDLEAFPPLFSGDQVADARLGADQNGGRTVDFTLDAEGRQRFADHTASHIGDSFAITLDGSVITAPVIQSSIPDGLVQISHGGIGGYPQADAERLVAILRGGELPVPIREVTATGPAPAGGPVQALHVENRGGPGLVLRIAGTDVRTVACGEGATLLPGEAGVPLLPWALEVRRATDGRPLLTQQATELPRWLVLVGETLVGGGLQATPVEGPPGPSCAPG